MTTNEGREEITIKLSILAINLQNELSNPDWEGSTVREIALAILSVMDEDDEESAGG